MVSPVSPDRESPIPEWLQASAGLQLHPVPVNVLSQPNHMKAPDAHLTSRDRHQTCSNVCQLELALCRTQSVSANGNLWSPFPDSDIFILHCAYAPRNFIGPENLVPKMYGKKSDECLTGSQCLLACQWVSTCLICYDPLQRLRDHRSFGCHPCIPLYARQYNLAAIAVGFIHRLFVDVLFLSVPGASML